jgi:uncharacterized membrane protein YphA (DoxX/SURF4 family)
MSGMDPVAHWVLRLALALLFGAASAQKLRDLPGFTVSLRDYRVLPRALSAPAAAALAAAEVGAAAALLLPGLDPAGPATALALLALYAGAIGWNLARGRRHIDCGCLGPGRRQSLSGWLIARNAVLCVGALLLLAPPARRETSWIDALSLLGSVALLALLWNAVHQLGAVRAAAVRPAAGRSA